MAHHIEHIKLKLHIPLYLMEDCVATLQFKKTHPDAIVPTRGTQMSAGWDLYAIEDTLVTARATKVRTGIAAQFPSGTYGKVLSRSGLYFNHGVESGAGVIDADYCAEIVVGLTAPAPYLVKKGDRCAQLVIHYVYDGECVVVEEFKEKYPAHVGFGSTGK